METNFLLKKNWAEKVHYDGYQKHTITTFNSVTPTLDTWSITTIRRIISTKNILHLFHQQI